MPITELRNFSSRLWLAGAQESAPEGSLRRAAGVHPMLTPEVRSRAGWQAVASLPADAGTAHSMEFFAEAFWIGTDAGKLYRVPLDGSDAELIEDGFDGTVLYFAVVAPAPGLPDELFVSGGGAAVGPLKITSAGQKRSAGITPPLGGFTGAGYTQREKYLADPNLVYEWVKQEALSRGAGSFATALAGRTVSITIGDGDILTVDCILPSPWDASRFLPTDFEPFPGSSDLDYLSFLFNVREPASIEFIQIGLDFAPGDDAGEFGSSAAAATLAYAEENIPARQRIIDEVTVKTTSLPKYAVKKTIPALDLLPIFGTAQLTPDLSFQQVDIPKATFAKSRAEIVEGQDFSQITAMRVTVKAIKGKPSTVVDIDMPVLIGGYGIRGEVSYFLTYRDSQTGTRSNPSPELPVKFGSYPLDRQPVLLRKLPVGEDVVPSGVDEIEVWRTLGDGAVPLLASRWPIDQVREGRAGGGEGEILDIVSDLREYNIRPLVPGVGTLTLNADQVSGYFSSAVDYAIPVLSYLEVGGERRQVRERTSESGFVLDAPATWPAGSSFEWLLEAPVLGDLEFTDLPFNNVPPEADFGQVEGPHLGRVWWLSDRSGQRGRVYYSQAGRPEGTDGFLEVTSDSEVLVKLVRWGGELWVFSTQHLYRIVGEGAGPYQIIQVENIPGTVNVASVVPTAGGIIYEASDGVHAFNGSSSELISAALSPLFFGLEEAGYAPFACNSAAADAKEYIIAGDEAAFAFNFQQQVWRDMGLGLDVVRVFTSPTSLVGVIGSQIVALEVEGESLDGGEDGTPIPFAIETQSVRAPSGSTAILRAVLIDAEVGSEILYPTLTVGELEVPLPIPPRTGGRQVTEIPLWHRGYRFALRLEGDVREPVKVYGVAFDWYVAPGLGERQGR